ncbi:MAG: HAD family hydrolase [Clostridia bacterium]|nr:HAD family hydrolase [Clostridia bacterium]
MCFKAVIFDLDGTLLDTLEDLAFSMNQALSSLGFPTHAVEKYKYLVGDGVEVLAMRALPQEIQDISVIQNCVLKMREYYHLHWCDKTKPYKGIPEMLEKLAKKNIRMSVLSNKPHDFTKIVVSRYFPHIHFDFVLGARADVPKKPDPKGALEIAKESRLEPDSFLYLGDTNTDMLTATEAGMFAVGALWGFRKAEELLESGAKKLIETPLDLLKLF